MCIVIICTLLFFAVLRSHWLNVTSDGVVTAGLWSFDFDDGKGDPISWGDYCKVHRFTEYDDQPVSKEDSEKFCQKIGPFKWHLVQIERALLICSITLTIFAIFTALYLHLGNPSQRIVVLIGFLPFFSIFSTGVLCMVVLILWQSYFGPFDNGDCFSITVAATTLAYAVALSMIIRWRWPGLCAVPSEQQELRARGYIVDQEVQPSAVPTTVGNSNDRVDPVGLDSTHASTNFQPLNTYRTTQ